MTKILGWEIEQTNSLIDFIAKNKSKTLSQTFSQWANKNSRQTFSVRNYYYKLKKAIKTNKNLLHHLDLMGGEKNVLFCSKHFSFEEEQKLLEYVFMNKKFMSVRSACLKYAGGDKNLMMRYQNKFRQLLKQKKELCEKVLNKIETKNNIVVMPSKDKTLSQEDINSLFLGLVKLVRDKAKTDMMIESDKKRREMLKLMKKQSLQEKQKSLLQEVVDVQSYVEKSILQN